MKWQPLRERVAREVHAIWRDGFNEETRAAETWDANEVFHDEFYADADRILAALGLDDWDEMLNDDPSGHDIYVRIGARVWEAASTATGGKDDA